ncbi:MAG: phosphoesterase [Bacteroides sp. SM23_62_1]|nr:MAG: phosphoesterase [Bacteroides sp. SM23_62_1]
MQLPYDRFIHPAGNQVYFGHHSLENHALDAVLSPDQQWLVVQERYSIVFINTTTEKVMDVFYTEDIPELRGAMNTYSGICWHTRDGIDYIWFSAVCKPARSYVLQVKWDGSRATVNRILEYFPDRHTQVALPNELLIRDEPDGEYLYVVLNGNNKIIKQELETGDTVWLQETGVAPYGLAEAKDKLYITNWGGRPPEVGDTDIAGVPWGVARVDPETGATRDGSVSVIDPETGALLKTIVVGLHPNDIVASKDQKFIYIANANSDHVSVINTLTDEVVETISVRMLPEKNPFFGDSPNGLAVSPNRKILYVANGMDNAIAVVKLGKKSSAKGKLPESYIEGFIPTGAYPSSICLSYTRQMYITNLEGEGARLALIPDSSDTPSYNVHHMLTSVSILKIPGKKVLKQYTEEVIALNQLSRLYGVQLPPRENVEPRPVPERIGEPSVFKHVVYIIKENRTYDQVLGDMKQGRGDSSLCIYGEEITPNTHKLADDFLLMDAYHVSGKCSAEGHQWTDAAIVTDYIEKNVRSWFRSYPHVQNDALVYAPTGFIWDNAVRHGKTVRIYGEAARPLFDNAQGWQDIYSGFLRGEPFNFTNMTTVAPVRTLLSPTYPGYDHHAIPDVLRADAFIRELKEYEAMEGDSLPELIILALPNDHTAGTRPGFPTPRAQVADNDLALGKIVEAITNSRFWKNTVIFVTEDDSQDGWDHLSAYRTVGLVISPYSRLRQTVSSYYAQPSMVRTIEQILGLPPMNIQDAIASPMFDCFTTTPDYTAYKAVPNRIPLDEMNPPLSSLSGRELHYARQSLDPQFDRVDAGNDDILNRILWYTARGKQPYPAKYAGEDGEEEDEE